MGATAVDLTKGHREYSVKYADTITCVRRLSREEVATRFVQRGYVLLEPEYKNAKTKMRVLCRKHGEQIMTYDTLKKGSGCIHCGRERSTSFHRMEFSDVEKAFKDRGYTLLETTYENAQTNLKYLCLNDSHGIQSITYNNLKGGKGCGLCSRERQRRSGSVFWKGGVTSLNDYLRSLLKTWRQKSLKTYNYTCFVTEKRGGKLHVHHVEPYSVIRDRILAELRLPIKESIGDYSEDDLDRLTSSFLKFHEENLGLPLRKDIHALFHKMHGFEASFADLVDFKRRYIAGEFTQNGRE